ncbi:PDR/VanB family oxidoreductase [Jatrophihabitans telluris]
METAQIRSFELARHNGEMLPSWEPGAHVDLHLPSGTVRQYSLCSDPADLRRYRIAVLDVDGGRGGSREAHRALEVGDRVRVSAPRNHFPLHSAPEYLLIAGGIGITPILPMARSLAAGTAAVRLVYVGRSRPSMAFIDELTALGVDTRIVTDDVDGRLDLSALDIGSAAVYACGPVGLLDALAERVPSQSLHVERFTAEPAARDAHRGSDIFEVELAQSGLVLVVQPGVSVLQAIRSAGVDVPSSCEMGICGTCETKVLSGDIDHYDDLLTEAERASGATMMICVSRSRGPRLTLDR